MSNPDAIQNLIAFEPSHPAVPVLRAILDRWGEVHHECRFEDKPLCLVSQEYGFYTGVPESWLDFFDTDEKMSTFMRDMNPGYWPVAQINMRDGTGRAVMPQWRLDEDINLIKP